MKGSTFLKAAGILMMISSVVYLWIGIFLGGLGALIASFGAAFQLTFPYWAALFLSLGSGICQLLAGIQGVSHCKNREKSKKLILWGIVCTVFGIFSAMISVINREELYAADILPHIPVPVLFTCSAVAASLSGDGTAG